MIPRAEWRILYLLCILSMLSFLAVGFPVSQAPCFASWSHSELETYALTAWSSSVPTPTPLDTAACPSASVKQASMVNELQRGAVDLGIPAEESQETAGAAPTLTDAAMSSALMALYDSTNGPWWGQRWNWGDTSMSACRWYGVCCNATFEEFQSCPRPDWESGDFTGSCCTTSGVVTILILSENNLRGTIPSAFSRLNYLQSLELSSNQLSGTIPSELGQLGNLGYLNLSSNQLNGAIPSELGQLSALKYLYLSSNQFSGAIPSELGQLSALMISDLRFNQLSGTIPPELGQLSALNALGLAANQLSGTIPSELGTLSALKYLYLYSNQLSGTIPSELGTLSALKYLYLYSNQLSGTIPSELGQLSALNALYLYSNQLSGTIPSQLGTLSALNSLDLSSNQLYGALESFCNSSSLESLDISENLLNGEIPSCLFLLQQLKVLRLSSNRLTGTLSNSAFPSSSICTVSIPVAELDLSRNFLQGDLDFFTFFSRLTVLNLRGNRFSGPLSLTTYFGIEINGFCNLVVSSHLSQLDVSDNLLTSVGSLPETLTVLWAPRNKLEGSIMTLALLRSAVLIDLHENLLISGDIPRELMLSSTLLYLFIANTSLASSRGSQLPETLYFSDTRVTSFVVGMDAIECATVESKSAPNAVISLSPSYYSYNSCTCGVGKSFYNAKCSPCKAGYYNDDHQSITCKPCPTESYAPTTGSVTCLPCALPLYLAQSSGTKCASLTPYIFGAIVIVIGVPVLIFAIIFCLSILIYVGYLASDWWRAREFRRITLLIQKRARDEIPADLLIHYRDLKMEAVIGAGSFARVYKGKWNHTLVAIKELTGVHTLMASLEAERNVSISEAGSQQDEGIQKLVNEFRSEVLVMSRLHHPNVLLLVGACSEFPDLCIVTEFLPNGALYDALHKRNARDTLTLKQQMQWLLETASGMAYLHEQGLMHRDLKSLNVLLDDLNRAKLCDFGLAKIVGDAQRTMTSGVGSLLWMPPEVMRGDSYSFSADVYSWGIMAWEIMSPEEELFPGLSTYEVAKQIVAGHRPKVNPVWSYCVCQLMQHCWRGEKEDRPTFVEVMLQLEEVVQPEATDDAMRGDGKDMGLATPLLQMSVVRGE
jgi:Leucine-rich repeat (LRR) protein